jgi:hypothetical protein
MCTGAAFLDNGHTPTDRSSETVDARTLAAITSRVRTDRTTGVPKNTGR